MTATVDVDMADTGGHRNSPTVPALAPLFRSDQQMRILAVLFTNPEDEFAIGEIAQRANVAQATASREVARLAEHGLVVTRMTGRNKLVRHNRNLPWAPELRKILDQTVGVLGRLGEVLSGLEDVEEAFVFGSWAARDSGEPGSYPRDIDVVVVGGAELRSVRRACRELEHSLRVEINPLVIDRVDWDSHIPEPFVAQIKQRPLTPIALNHERDI